MAIRYDIFPDINLIIYVCAKVVIPEEFFKVGDIVSADPRRKFGMKVIIDFFHAELEITVKDIHLAVAKSEEIKKQGVDQIAVLTTSSSLHYLGETIKLLAPDVFINFGIFHTEQDVINWLGTPSSETQRHWAELKGRGSE